jgi:hypothetical protein
MNATQNNKNEQIVEMALQSQEFKENKLDHVALARLADFADEEIEFVKLFWDPTFNGSWIYLTKEMVVDWMGYSDDKSTMSNFYTRNLLKNYEENVDFKEVDQNDDLVKNFHSTISLDEKPGNRAKFYLITGECLKGLLMSAQTMKGKIVRKIYIKTEKLVFIMLEVIKEQQLRIKEVELQETKKQIKDKDQLLINAMTNNLKLDNKILNIQQYKLSGYVYVVHTAAWSDSNIFRIGTCSDLESRLAKYQVGRTPGEEMYYVYYFKSEDAETLETLLRTLLVKFRIVKTKDQYMVHWSILLPFIQMVCNNFRQILIHNTNELITNNIDIAIPPISPEKIDINIKLLESFSKIDIIQDKNFISAEPPNYVEELPLTDEEILLLPNASLRKAANNRNKFIHKMHDNTHKVMSKYQSIEHPITLMCVNNHYFEITPNNQTKGLDRVLCRICENVRKTNEATLLVKDRQMICLNYKERRFRCGNNHDFITSKLDYILHQNGGCPECNRRVKLTKQHYHTVASNNQGKWIETEAVPTALFLTEWECSKGHHFRAKYHKANDNPWEILCMECKDPNHTLTFLDRINIITSMYPTGRLLTDPSEIKTQYTRITLACDHIKSGWDLILKNFLSSAGWRCHACKKSCINKLSKNIDNVQDGAPGPSGINNRDNSDNSDNKTNEQHNIVNIPKIKGKERESSDVNHYDLVFEITKLYKGSAIVSAKEDINIGNDKITIKCPHIEWTCQTKNISHNKSWRCRKCKKILEDQPATE